VWPFSIIIIFVFIIIIINEFIPKLEFSPRKTRSQAKASDGIPVTPTRSKKTAVWPFSIIIIFVFIIIIINGKPVKVGFCIGERARNIGIPVTPTRSKKTAGNVSSPFSDAEPDLDRLTIDDDDTQVSE
jgi:hypothetical protein